MDYIVVYGIYKQNHLNGLYKRYDKNNIERPAIKLFIIFKNGCKKLKVKIKFNLFYNLV